MTNGQTLNEAFNKELEKRHGGPECQECGGNLTGRHVYRVDNVWCCGTCFYTLDDIKKNSRCRNRHDD